MKDRSEGWNWLKKLESECDELMADERNRHNLCSLHGRARLVQVPS